MVKGGDTIGQGKARFFLDRETKRMVRYKGEEDSWGTVYIPKHVFGDDPIPEEIELTVTW